ncbi:hypothetical protein [Bacillus sp. MMSF_3328]|uniref:hypothetical protein n=1 Tax=Bacillus sp. MMSF_3328 TaxID=3047080 RepID=UPI00273E4A04|nr:hypothetical protein [Bacillus sp. MMSF_3328]
MDKEKFIMENWGEKRLDEIKNRLGISLKELLETALKLNLQNRITPHIGRRWTNEEDAFLTENSHRLSVKDASNLIYRSHYATYQRVRVLGLHEMINKK